MQNQKGFSLIELLVVIVIIGIAFFFLIEAIDVTSLFNKSKNSVIKSHMEKVALSVETFNSSFGRYPNEEEFLDSLYSNNTQLEPHCSILGDPDFECIYKSEAAKLPIICDLSFWRRDKEGKNQCYIRYFAGDLLSFNKPKPIFRLYSMTYSSDYDIYVFDSSIGSVVRCPYTVDDYSDLSDCKEL